MVCGGGFRGNLHRAGRAALAPHAASGSPADALQRRPGAGGRGRHQPHRRDLARRSPAGIRGARPCGKAAARHAGMRSRGQLLRALGVIIWLVVVNSYSAAGQQLPATVAGHTQIVLLGTGTPRADPQRSGPATAVVVNGTPYLVDAGPGIVRRAAAAYDKGVKGLAVANLQTAFITHLHSDHTV